MLTLFEGSVFIWCLQPQKLEVVEVITLTNKVMEIRRKKRNRGHPTHAQNICDYEHSLDKLFPAV